MTKAQVEEQLLPSERAEVDKKVANRALFASLIGSSIEWFDFFIYATVAGTVLNVVFFPVQDAYIAVLMSYATLSITFFIRPIGGLFFAHFGDRIGRKNTLIVTLVLMGISTSCIGILPGYTKIGIWAPILLILFRCLQGISVGGEQGGAITLAVEYAKKNNRGFFGSIPQIGMMIGMAMGTIVYALLMKMPNEQFMSWGWRIPFFLSAAMVFVGLWIRLKVSETPVFQKAKETGNIAKSPISEVFRYHWKSILLSIGIIVGCMGSFYVFTTFIIYYASTHLGFEGSSALYAVTAGSLIGGAIIPLFGKRSDKIGRKITYKIGVAGILLFIVPYFIMVNQGSVLLLLIAVIISLGFYSIAFSVQGTLYSENFPTNVRYTGITLAHQIAAALAGGTTPMIATFLLHEYNNSWIPIAIYVILLCSISLFSLSRMKEMKGMDLE